MIGSDARRALQEAFGDAVAFDVPMSRHTSLRIGGPADALVSPGDAGAVAALLDSCAEHGLPHLVLGAGFNCLVSDAGIEGVVVKLNRMREIEIFEQESGHQRVRAEAGVTHATLTKRCVERGLSGLEFGAGIPGVVGGWIPMNAGIGTKEMKDVVVEIDVVAPGETVRSVPREDLDFHYRALRGLAPGSIVVAAVFDVTTSTTEAVRAEVDRLLALRSGTQPLNVPSCGSVFKNPEGDFAGRLIEAAGLKSKSVGGAQISPVHANFIANTGGATAADVHRLMELARETVEKETGIRLEAEVRMLGRKEGDA